MMQFLFRRRRRGFSLLEMLIGLVLLAVGLGAMAALSLSVTNIMSGNQHYAAACNLAEQKLEELRNEVYTAIIDGADATAIDSAGGTTGDAIYTRSWDVTIDTPATNMKTIEVSVSWSQWNETKVYTITGVVAND